MSRSQYFLNLLMYVVKTFLFFWWYVKSLHFGTPPMPEKKTELIFLQLENVRSVSLPFLQGLQKVFVPFFLSFYMWENRCVLGPWGETPAPSKNVLSLCQSVPFFPQGRDSTNFSRIRTHSNRDTESRKHDKKWFAPILGKWCQLNAREKAQE